MKVDLQGGSMKFVEVDHKLIDKILLVDNSMYTFSIPVPNAWQRLWWRLLLGTKCKIKKGG